MIRHLAKGLALSALLAAGAAAAELKIAVIDTQRALLASEEAQDLIKDIQRELQPQQDQVNRLRDEIVALQERAQKDAEVMSAQEQRALAKQIEDKQIDFRFQGNKLQKEVEDRQNEMLQEMVPKLDAVLRDLIDLEGYDLIMERGSLRYANQKHDITRKVTEKMNEKRN